MKATLTIMEAESSMDEASALVSAKQRDCVYADEVCGWGKTPKAALRNCRSVLRAMLKRVEAEIAKEGR